MEVVLIFLAVAAFYLGYKLGTDNGRLQTLENLNQRIAFGLDSNSEFARKYGVRGVHLVLDYMGADAKLGTGYHPSPYVGFVVVQADDFENKFATVDRHHNNDISADDGGTSTVKSEDAEEDDLKDIVPSRIFDGSESGARNAGVMTSFLPSTAFAEIVGGDLLTRTEAVQRLWAYIEINNLQDSTNPRAVNCDTKLFAVSGKSQISLLEMMSVVGKNLTKTKP